MLSTRYEATFGEELVGTETIADLQGVLRILEVEPAALALDQFSMVVQQGGAEAEHHAAAVLALAFHFYLADDPVHTFRVRQETVEAALVSDVKADEDEARDARGQAQQVDQRVELLLPKTAQRRLRRKAMAAETGKQEVLQHGSDKGPQGACAPPEPEAFGALALCR